MGAYSAPPDHLAVPYLRGLPLRGKKGKGKRGGKGEEKGGKGGEGEIGRTTLHTPCRKFLATPLTKHNIQGLARASPHSAAIIR